MIRNNMKVASSNGGGEYVYNDCNESNINVKNINIFKFFSQLN